MADPFLELGGQYHDEDPFEKLGGVYHEEKPVKKSISNRAKQFFMDNVVNPSKDIFHQADSFAGGFNQGLANIPVGFANLGISGLNFLPGVDIPHIKQFDFAEHNPSSTAGEIASFFAPGGVAKGLSKVPEVVEAAKGLGKLPGMQKISEIISNNPLKSKIAGNALLGGAYSDPDHQLLGMGLGAAVPLGIEGIKAIANPVETLAKSINTNLTPEQLQKNLDITRGTETGLGDVIGSPMAKRWLENILTKVPLNNANEIMMKNAGKVVEKGNDLLNTILGKNDKANIESHLNDALQDSYKLHKKEKNLHYDDVNNLADKLGFDLKLKGFSNEAKNFIDAINDTNVLKYEPEAKKILSKLDIYKNPTQVEKLSFKGSNIQLPDHLIPKEFEKNISLKEANILKGKLKEFSDKYSLSPSISDRNASGIFKKLNSSLGKDIHEELEKFGNKELHNEYKSAQDNYGKKFAPFLDRELYKFSIGRADPDTLVSSFIKTGKSNDRATLLSKLIDRLPEDKKSLPGYIYLQRAIDEEGNINPNKLKTLLSKNSLGDRQFNALFPNDNLRKQLRDYISLVSKNEKGLRLMENPATGQMNMDILPLFSKSKGGLAAKILTARPLTNLLTSEDVRNNVVRNLIEKQRGKQGLFD